MLTAKDMDFAKKVIAKELISKAEMQRHLDDLTLMRKSGKQLTLQQLLTSRGVISSEELKFLQGPKKRIVHCRKCKTMYRAQEEDVGKRFKCKKCGTMVIVPAPGQTQISPIKEIQQEIKDDSAVSAPPAAEDFSEGGIISAVDYNAEQTTQPKITHAPPSSGLQYQDTSAVAKTPTSPSESRASEAIKPALRTPPASKEESTIMLDLDDNDKREEPAAQELQEQGLVISADEELEPSVLKPASAPQSVNTKPEPPAEMTIMLDLDDEEDDDVQEQEVSDEPEPELQEQGLVISADEPEVEADTKAQPVVSPLSPKPGIAPVEETTIVLDLDDGAQEQDASNEPELQGIVIADDDSPQTKLESPTSDVSPSPSPVASDAPQPPSAASASTSEGTEMTIMLDLDDNDAEEQQEQLVEDIEPAPPAPAAKEVAASAATSSPAPESTSKAGGEAEMTIMLDLDENENEYDDEDSDPVIPSPQTPAAKEQAPEPKPEEDLDEWALAGHGGEGAEGIEIAPQLPPPVKKEPPPPLVSPSTSEDLDEWALVGHGGEGADAVEIAPKIPSRDELSTLQSKSETPPQPVTISATGAKEKTPQNPKLPPPNFSEQTIMIDLDDEDDDEDEDEI